MIVSLRLVDQQSGPLAKVSHDVIVAPIPIEIKSGATLQGNFFDGLAYWTRLAGHQGASFLIHGGRESIDRQGTKALAWHDLNLPW